jgi:hypothetical protein
MQLLDLLGSDYESHSDGTPGLRPKVTVMPILRKIPTKDRIPLKEYETIEPKLHNFDLHNNVGNLV